jgi:ATP-binding cassette subfamily B protein
MRFHDTERLTLPDRKYHIDARQTTILPAVPEGQQRRSRAIRLPILRLDARSQQVSPEVAELIKRREQIANQETMSLQAFVIGQEQTPALQEQSASSFPGPQPPDTPPLEPAIQKTMPEQIQSTHTTEQKKKLSLWKILQKVTNNLRRRRVPVLHQVSAVECGAACLAMLLSYYGRKTSVSEIREHCGVGRDGLSALSIVKAARSYDMRVRALTLQESDFSHVTLPVIIHWEFNHFIVVERWSPGYVDVVDPATGRRRMTIEEFDQGFTGVVLMLEPGAHFSRESTSSRLSLRTYVGNFVAQAPLSLLQVLVASIFLQGLGLIIPLLSKVAIDQLIPLKMLSSLQLFGVGIIMLLLALTVTSLLRSSILLYVQAHVDMSMLFNFFEHLLLLPQRFFLQRSSGDILARLSSNITIRDTISNQLFSTLLDGSFVIVYFIILFSQSSLFALAVLVIGILQGMLLLCTNRQIGELARRQLVAQGKSQGYIAEILAGIRTLKAAGAEYRALEQWSNLLVDQMNASVHQSYLTMLVGTGMATLSTSAPLALLWLGTMQVINGSMQVGTMLALNALAGAILSPLGSLVLSSQQLQLVRSHLERVADVVEAEPEQDVQTVKQPPRLVGHIELEHVSFQYDPNSALVLKDINLEIKPGQKVAIVGRTGSGKSTLGNLLLGLFIPTKGEIFYDKLPLRSLNYQAVRSQFGVVMQEASIFSGSIRENIALNNPNMNMEQVIKAACLAAIHDDIMEMPMEYETFVSEGGNALSGGQRQRLALARALANSPAIILLDEATSSLDVVTEHIVERNMSRLSCTQIIIAHRLSTIRNADVILVLHDGEIVERGTHAELLRRNGYYARLIQSQMASGEIQ